MNQHHYHLMALAFVAGLGLACAPADPDACKMSGSLPELSLGQASYRVDGQQHTETGGYRLDFPADIVVSGLTLNIKNDSAGQAVKDRVTAGDFPICVPLDSADDGGGYALFEGSAASYSTDASHLGQLSILAQEGEALLGRFAFSAVQNGGSQVLEVSDGAFHLSPR